MAFEVTRVKRLDENHVHIYYDVWHPNCKPCSLKHKIKLYNTKQELTHEQAREIIGKGVHIRTGSI